MSNTFLSQSDFKKTVHHTDKLRVAAYCRVSTGNDEQQSSYIKQKEYYTKLISFKDL